MEKSSKDISRVAGKIAKPSSRPAKSSVVAKSGEDFPFSPKPKRLRGFWQKYSTLLTVSLCILMLIGAAIFLITKYDDRAAAGTNIAGINVAGKNAFAIRNAINDLENAIKLTLSYNGKTVDANIVDLGIKVDVDKTTQAALLTSNDWLNRLNIFGQHNIKLIATVDWAQTTKFLNSSFPELITDPRDAGVIYDQNTEKFVSQSSATGKVIDMTKIKSIVEDLIVRPRASVATVAVVEQDPPIGDAAAQAAADFANARLALHINLKFDGRTVYYTDPADIANWMVFAPEGDQLDVSFDEAKVKDFLATTVANSLSQKPVNGLAIAGSGGTILKQVSAGSGGQTVGNVAHLSGQIVDSLKNNTSLDAEITLTAKEATMDKFVAVDNHWIEVNLSTQYITLYDGTNAVGTYIASSGIPPMDTPVGLFKVWLKVTSQTMRGGGDAPGFPAYSLPGVKWVSYFNGDVAFHTKYWNDIWGRPSSHGCINLHEADARTVFDFVQIGTPVWVHY